MSRDIFLQTTPEFQEDIPLLADLFNYATKRVTDLASEHSSSLG